MYSLILFDLDGTLTDPKIGITKSVQHALEAIGQPEPDIEKLTFFIGPPLKEMFMSYCNVDSDMGDFLVAKYRERFSTIGLFENEIYEGIPELLNDLKQAGKKIALATSKPLVFAEKILEHFNIKEYFDIVIGSELSGLRTKKSDVIKEVIVQTGKECAIGDIVMVGDRMYDIEGAKAFGMASIGVTYGYGGYDELKNAGADYIAESVCDLGENIIEVVLDERLIMDNRIVFHIDVNSAFLSWEAVYRLKHMGDTLDLRDIPSAVGGDISQRHGVILAKSIPAKRYGISTGEPVTDALKKCPGLMLVPPNHGLYENSSRALMNILREYSPVVEQYSIDEAFVDMTGALHGFDSPVAAAESLRDRIREELGFTVNIGVSSNKLLAKMASDFEKPDKVHTLFPNEIERKMWKLSAQELFFVGKATLKKLNGLGVHTIGDIARMDVSLLKSYFKKNGEVMWNYANGIDNSPVLAEPAANKGYGNSTTIAFDVTDANTAKNILLALCETVATRLRKDNMQAEALSVAIKDTDFHQITHQCVLSSATNITQELHENACRLFDECWNHSPIRLLGIYAMKVKEYENLRQLDLFSNDKKYEKLEKLDSAVDLIRNKFGTDSVKRAVFLDNKISHMPGKLSRGKKEED